MTHHKAHCKTKPATSSKDVNNSSTQDKTQENRTGLWDNHIHCKIGTKPPCHRYVYEAGQTQTTLSLSRIQVKSLQLLLQ